jgi:trehalose 6-phosphate synthase
MVVAFQSSAKPSPWDALVVVSYQLPVHTAEQVEPVFHRGSTPGNRINALAAGMRHQRATWVGGCHVTDGPGVPFSQGQLDFEPVLLSCAERAACDEFCHHTLWPLYHDIIAHPEFRQSGWAGYETVNRHFADRIVEVAEPGAAVWILDHHLQLVPALLRERRPDLRIGIFIDIPFPPMELLYHLPWHRELLQGLLGADLLGFQLPRHQQNFIEAAQVTFGHPVHPGGLHLGTRHLRTATYPMAVQTRALSLVAAQPEAAEQAQTIRALLGNPRVLLLAFDQLDCTAGIHERLQAFEDLIKRRELDPRDTVLVQIATTSDEEGVGNSKMRDDIDRLVGRINGDAARFGHPPVIYVHSTGADATMAGLYRAADVLLSTPLRDGMSLAAKEYIACRQADDGAVVLSTLSGAAEQLTSAYEANPYDLEALKACLLRAVHSTAEDRATRMRALRKQVADNDLARWAYRFLRDLGSHTSEVSCSGSQSHPTLDLPLVDRVKGYPSALRRWPGRSTGGSSASLS